MFTSSGTIVDGTTLEFAAYVPASGIRDASWAGSVLHTIRSFDLFAYPPQELETELEVWTGGPTLDRQRQIRLPGTPLRVFTGGAAPVVVTHVRNVPRIAVVHCGNGLADGAEACDGADLRGMTCAGLGLGNGALACTSSCTLDTAGCGAPPFCGDHVVNAPNELCDGADLGTVAGLYGCDLFGLPSGSLACSADCLRLEPTACSHCGDGAVFGGGVFPGVPGSEQCDGDDLAGQTCVSLHFTGGTLSCRADCSLDTSACLPDCTTTRCDDGDPCTADVCEPDRGCVGIAIADCQTVFGYSVQRYTLPDYGAKGVCRVTCRSDYRGGLVFGTDDTFEIPETPFACWDGEQLVVVPSEAGSLVSRRKGREGMRATNTGARNEVLDSCDVDLAFGRPGGWVKRTDGVVVEGRHREMVVDRSSGRPRRFRIDSRFAGPGRTVPLSGRVKALPDCAQDPETLCRH